MNVTRSLATYGADAADGLFYALRVAASGVFCQAHQQVLEVSARVVFDPLLKRTLT
jgi:hypothetical protein